MAISFEKLISDVQNFNDSLEIPVNENEKLRLGDIRGQLSNTLARYEAALQAEREQRGALEHTLETLKNAAPPSGDRREPSPPPAGTPTDEDLLHDPWSKKLLDRVQKTIDERAETLRGEHNAFGETVKKGTGALTQLLLKTLSAQEFGRFNDWPKDYDPTRAFKEAGEKGFIDRTTGLPDFARLHHELTEDARIESRAKAIAEKMIEEDRKALAEKNQSKFQMMPGPRANRSKSQKKEPQYRTLQDYMMSDDALPTDDEIRSAGGLLNIIR